MVWGCRHALGAVPAALMCRIHGRLPPGSVNVTHVPVARLAPFRSTSQRYARVMPEVPAQRPRRPPWQQPKSDGPSLRMPFIIALGSLLAPVAVVGEPTSTTADKIRRCPVVAWSRKARSAGGGAAQAGQAAGANKCVIEPLYGCESSAACWEPAWPRWGYSPSSRRITAPAPPPSSPRELPCSPWRAWSIAWRSCGWEMWKCSCSGGRAS